MICGEEGLAEGAGGETEDDEGPASCSQEVPRRSRAAWLCILSPIGLWGAHSEEMRRAIQGRLDLVACLIFLFAPVYFHFNSFVGTRTPYIVQPSPSCGLWRLLSTGMAPA
jgi:hypothetical protein